MNSLMMNTSGALMADELLVTAVTDSLVGSELIMTGEGVFSVCVKRSGV